MKSPVSDVNPALPIYLFILSLPFFLFHNIVPFLSDATIGSDYLLYPIRWQMELLFSIKTGSFPLYIPGFAYGHASSALTLGQIYHPLSHLASLMPGYWMGKAVEWNNFFKFLSLGITHLVLFLFLQKMRVNTLFSLLLSFLAVYNLRLLELYRHGAPLEAFTAHLVLCAAIGWYFIHPTKLAGPSGIICLTYLLISSGHPEEMYYGFLGAGVFTLLAPFYSTVMLPDRAVDMKTVFLFWLKVGFFLCLGTVLSSLYLLPYYFDFIADNVQRVVQDYSFAVMKFDSFVGTINNFFIPLRSRPLDAFGGSSMILIAFALPLIRSVRIKIPFSIWLIWGFLIFVFLHMQGSRTPVHRLSWEYLPFASSIRDPGRISMILPFFIMLLLAWVVRYEAITDPDRMPRVPLKPVALLACFSLASTVVYYIFFHSTYHFFPAHMLKGNTNDPVGSIGAIPYFWIELTVIILGILLLVCIVYSLMRTPPSGKLALLLLVLTVLQTGVVLKYRLAAWTEKKHDTPTFSELKAHKRVKLDYPYYQGGGLFPSIVVSHLERTFVEPFLGRIFTQVIPVESRSDAYRKMERNRLPHQLFIEKYSPEKARTITDGAAHMSDGRVELTYSSYNRLKFFVFSESPAMFGLSYPYSGKWLARINGKEASVYRANGAAIAVEIPEGESTIEFRYWSPAAFWGMVISCMSFIIIGLFISFRGMNKAPRYLSMMFIVAAGAGGFLLWYTSLYNGENLETEYVWTYTPDLKTPNLAYGKKNWLSSCTIFTSWVAREHELYRNRLVDGDRSAGSGFTTRLCDRPAWFIDLHRTENIATILMYESSRDSSINTRRLTLELSEDGKKWFRVSSIDSPPDQDSLLRIVFDKPERARYIKIQASGRSKLSFDEIEVYGPQAGIQAVSGRGNDVSAQQSRDNE